jgi:hypothetical protein
MSGRDREPPVEYRDVDYPGVAFDKVSGRWRAYVERFGHRISLGTHRTPELAALARRTFIDEHPLPPPTPAPVKVDLKKPIPLPLEYYRLVMLLYAALEMPMLRAAAVDIQEVTGLTDYSLSRIGKTLNALARREYSDSPVALEVVRERVGYKNVYNVYRR